jgi:hypothetical protein
MCRVTSRTLITLSCNIFPRLNQSGRCQHCRQVSHLSWHACLTIYCSVPRLTHLSRTPNYRWLSGTRRRGSCCGRVPNKACTCSRAATNWVVPQLYSSKNQQSNHRRSCNPAGSGNCSVAVCRSTSELASLCTRSKTWLKKSRSRPASSSRRRRGIWKGPRRLPPQPEQRSEVGAAFAVRWLVGAVWSHRSTVGPWQQPDHG